jgi:hypothetical protein
MSFPISANTGQTAIVNGVTYVYNAQLNTWKVSSNVANIYSFSQLSPVANIFEFDDVSNATDGYRNVFPLTYNQVKIGVFSPFSLLVSVNGILQNGFDPKYDTVWLGNVLTASRGYTIDASRHPTSNGYIKFADSLPPNSQVLIRSQFGAPMPTPKTYPFKPLDILTGI